MEFKNMIAGTAETQPVTSIYDKLPQSMPIFILPV